MTIVEDRRTSGDSIDFAAARRAMIDSQLRTSGVNTPFVLRRMGEVARERFVPPSRTALAYTDRAVPLEGGRWLPAPIVQAKMLEEARPRLDDRVLLVDGGSGYLAELLRSLVGSLDVVHGTDEPAGEGYSLLMIEGAVEQLPPTLIARLAPEARIITGLAGEKSVTRLGVGRVANGAAALLPVAELGIPVLPQFAAPKGWSF